MKTPTLNEFKAWARANRALALEVVAAQAWAECERERVHAYVLPIFRRYDFRQPDGTPIADPDHLYLCHDEAGCAAYYAECNKAHREHGFNGPEGHCPALTAESNQVEVEQRLIDAGAVGLLEADGRFCGERREKFLRLLLGACLAENKAA